jgi:putative membrane protein
VHEHGLGAGLGAEAASAPFPLAGVVLGGALLLFLILYVLLVRAGRRRGRAR